MIVPMKKITILALAHQREETLNALRGLGAVHLTPFQPPSGGDLEDARRAADEARDAVTTLERLADAPPDPGSDPAQAADHLREAIARIAAQRDRRDPMQRLEEAIRRLEPFGDFDPAAVRALADRGVSIRLFTADPRAALPLPDDAIQIPLRRDRQAFAFALVNASRWSHERAVEIPVPDRSLGALQQELETLRTAQAADDDALRKLAPERAALAAAAAAREDRRRWLEAREGMARNGPLLALQGYIPVPALPAFESEAKRQGWGWTAVDPTEQDAVPTLIRYARWTRPLQCLMEMLGIVPGYWEMDVSPVFLVFFSLFFAMLVGDAVYGLLFLGLTVLIRKKWKSAPPSLAPLLTLLSLATLVWGVLTGTYLGLDALPAPLRHLRIDWLTDADRLTHLCFLIGAVHMSIAHLWCLVRLAFRARSLTALAHLGWIGSSWMMYALAMYLILGQPFPPGIFWIFGVSVTLIFGFSVPFRQLKTEYASLLNLPFSIIGHFSDTVSYLRLYLVGSSSVVLVKAFNDIAFGGDAPLTWGRGLVGALMLFLVHALNILLSALSVLVHGVRLNALEFSSHLGIQWLGRLFTPFRQIAPLAAQPEPLTKGSRP